MNKSFILGKSLRGVIREKVSKSKKGMIEWLE